MRYENGRKLERESRIVGENKQQQPETNIVTMGTPETQYNRIKPNKYRTVQLGKMQ